ncbi:MAG: hypothetical protein AB2604_20895 [Candidatus Thiodiazotropha taylori]
MIYIKNHIIVIKPVKRLTWFHFTTHRAQRGCHIKEIPSQVTNKLGASGRVSLFASLSDPQAEGSGIYFNPHDASVLYVNIQHSAAADGDGTWAISRDARQSRERFGSTE